MQQVVTNESVFYHVWFGTKSRKWLLLGEVEDKIKELIKEIAKDKGIELLACETMVEHVHLLLKVRPSELSKVMHLLKGVSSRRIFQAFPELKLDARTLSFWQARYGAKVVPVEALKSIIEYIKTQKDRPEKFEESTLYPRFKPGV